MEFVTSWAGLIMILAAGHGNFTGDLLSLIEPAEYFKSRKVEISADRMLELAGKNPSDGKTQVAQLLAIRWLGAHEAEGGKAHSILGQIAGGRKAQDPSGFARDYAQRALARIEGKIPPARQAVAVDSLREDAWKWFPDDVSILGGLELRALGELPAPNEDRMRSIGGAFPPEAREELYKAADQIGNLRLDRVSLAFAGTKAKSEIVYLRFTGAWDPKRLAGYLRQRIPGGVSTARKGGEGESITLVSSKESAPAFAFIGRTELVAAAYLANNTGHVRLVERVLEVRAGNKRSAATGQFAKSLKKVPDRAYGLLLAELSGAMRQGMKGIGETFQAVPHRLNVHARCDKKINLYIQGTFKDVAEAKKFAESVERLKQKGLSALKDPPPAVKLTPEMTDILIKALGSLQVAIKDGTVTGSLQVPGEALPALVDQLHEVLKR